jgi:hypothetical protein
MNLKRKLTIAKTAQQFLNQAIAEMETGKDDNKYDYDLWHAFKDLKSIQDEEDAKEEPLPILLDNAGDPPDESTGFSLFNSL